MAIIFENKDCMQALKEFPDKFFDLAIVDPPYGIGESGAKNHSRSCLAKSKDYKPFYGNDIKTPDKDYFDELFRVSNNQIIWGGGITLYQKSKRTVRVGLCGTKKMAKLILPIANLRGLHLPVR